MKLCIDARPLQNGHRSRGVGVVVANLLPELGRLLTDDAVTLITQQQADAPPFFAHEERLPTFRLARPNRCNWLADQLLLPGLVERSGAELFLATDFNSYLVARPGLKVVAMAYDLIPFLFPEVMASQPWPVRLGWRVNFRKLRAADAVIAISQATKDDLVRLFGLAPEKVRVIYPGIDHSLFCTAHAADQARQSAVLERYSITGRYLLYVGDSEWRKNLRRCLEALAGIDPAVKLVLAGKRALTDTTLRGWIEELGLVQRVVLTGYVPDDDLPPLYGAAEAFLFPSLYEGFGLPVAEAMASGCPVITATVSSMPEVAGSAALLVDPTSVPAIRDAMARITADAALRQQLREAGMVQAAQFTWPRAAAETVQVLREMVAA